MKTLYVWLKTLAQTWDALTLCFEVSSQSISAVGLQQQHPPDLQGQVHHRYSHTKPPCQSSGRWWRRYCGEPWSSAHSTGPDRTCRTTNKHESSDLHYFIKSSIWKITISSPSFRSVGVGNLGRDVSTVIMISCYKVPWYSDQRGVGEHLLIGKLKN